MNLRNPFLLFFIGLALGIVLTYGLLHYATERVCPAQTTYSAQTGKQTTCETQTCPQCQKCIECPTCPETKCVNQTEITPLTDSDYPEMLEQEIKKASKSIHMIISDARYYTKYKNTTSNTILAKINSANKKGIETKILLDENKDNKAAYDYLTQNNITTKYTQNNTTTHAKLIILDNKTIIMGSSDLTQNSLEKNNEINIKINSEETAAHYEQYFQNLWNTTTKQN